MRPRGAGARIAQGGGFASGRAVVCAAERNTYGSGAVDAARFEDELAYGGDSRALACALAEPSGGRRGAAQRSPRGRPPGLRLVGEGAPDPALAAFGPAGGGRGSGIVFQRSRLNLTCPVLGAWAVRLISPKRLLWVSLGEKALLGVHAPANMSYLLFRAWCISAQPTVLGSRGGVSPDFGQLPSQSLSYLHGLRPMRGLCRMRAVPGSISSRRGQCAPSAHYADLGAAQGCLWQSGRSEGRVPTNWAMGRFGGVRRGCPQRCDH